MDIDAALACMRELVSETPSPHLYGAHAQLEEIAIQWESIDDWLSHGGFMPAAWMHGRTFAEPPF